MLASSPRSHARSRALLRATYVATLGILVLAALRVTAPASTAVLTRGPFLQRLTSTSVTIVWRTDTPAACSLAIRALTGPPNEVEGDVSTACTVQVPGLVPGTVYAYTPRADGLALTAESTFRTDGGQSRFSFLVLGDSGSGGAKQAELRDAMLGTPADFILHTGDMVYEDGAAADFDPHFFRPYAALLRRMMIWPSLGNHDVKTDDGLPWRVAFETPANNPAGDERYYSFDFGTAHVVVLDSNDTTDPGSPQHTFVAQDLAASTAAWKFVVFHASVYSSGAHESDLQTRTNLVPLFDQHGVDVVFMGHDHDYERTVRMAGDLPAAPGTGALYVTTGGGGAELRRVGRSSFTAYSESVFHFVRVQVDAGWLLLQMIREDGVVRDSVVLEKGAAPPAAVCGDGLVNDPTEQCDSADRAACPAAACRADCTCPPVCGDGRRNQPAEDCDGLDDASCPGRCLAACACGTAEQFVTLTPVADTHVTAEREKTWDHGAAPELKVDDEPTSVAYLKFDLSGVTAPVRAATLLLHCDNGSPDGGTVYTLSDSTWVEGDRVGDDSQSAAGPGLTFAQVDTNDDDKVDALDTSAFAPDLYRWLATLGPVVPDTTYAADVTAAVASAGGLVTFVVKNQSENGADFGAREHADPAVRPQLRLELAPPCDDGVLCTTDRFEPGTGCVHAPVAACCDANEDCGDGVPCNGAETCDTASGECRAGTAPACGDGDRCNGLETCDPTTGSCRPGTPLTCDDGLPCTEDSCDPDAGCVSESIGGVGGADCRLGALQADGPCADEPPDPVLGRGFAKRLARARTSIAKALSAPTPARATRMLGRADRELLALLRQARKRARTGWISGACLAEIEDLIAVPRTLLREPVPGKSSSRAVSGARTSSAGTSP
jgi:hypothetical protein